LSTRSRVLAALALLVRCCSSPGPDALTTPPRRISSSLFINLHFHSGKEAAGNGGVSGTDADDLIDRSAARWHFVLDRSMAVHEDRKLWGQRQLSPFGCLHMKKRSIKCCSRHTCLSSGAYTSHHISSSSCVGPMGLGTAAGRSVHGSVLPQSSETAMGYSRVI
jgi:hypothetical protein